MKYTIIPGILFICLLGSSIFLVYDKIKYGTDKPPKNVRTARNVSIAIFFLTFFPLTLFILYKLIPKTGDTKDYIFVLGLCVGLISTILSASYWAYYHYFLRKQYEDKKMPQHIKTLHTISMWYTVIVFISIITIMCSRSTLDCLLILQAFSY